MKKIIVVISVLLAAAIIAVPVGCAAKSEKAVTSESWTIEVKDAAGKTVEFTEKDAAKLEMVEVSAVRKKKDGSETTENWKGVLLSDVLDYCGVSQYTIIAVEALDGYNQEFESETVNDNGTILGFFLDGKEVSKDDGLVQLVVPTMGSKAWVKNVSKIYVVK